MADNTVTLILEGRVPLAEFARGIAGFNDLVSALSEEIEDGAVQWILDDLQYSSAVATARAEGSSTNVSRVVKAYAAVGAALEAGKELPYGQRVRQAVEKILDIGVERVRMETSVSDALISRRRNGALDIRKIELPLLQLVHGRRPALGAVKGRIQTLTSRGGLRFTLFDTNQDKAVSCYFEEGKQNQVRDLWGRLAIVEGVVSRDSSNGRPLAIRQVSRISPLPEPGEKHDFEAAMRAAPSLTGLSAVDAIRRVRDAE